MGATIWVLHKSTAGEDVGDDMDHSLLYRHVERLDQLALELGVRKLSDFFDDADFQFNLSEDDLPETWLQDHQQWFNPLEALPSLQALTVRLQQGSVLGLSEKARVGLIEELEDCVRKVEEAGREGDEFQFCIVL